MNLAEAVELGISFFWRFCKIIFLFINLGKRAIYHATYRDAGSGGVVRGNFFLILIILIIKHSISCS